MTVYVGERTRWNTVRIYTTDTHKLVTVVRLPDMGAADDCLHEHGFRVLGEWAVSDDMPPGHAVASIERFRPIVPEEPAVDVHDYGRDDGADG